MACCLRIALASFLLGGFASVHGDSPSEAKNTGRAASVNYAREIRPILSDNCFACHGPDDKARKAGLRLDTKEGAFAKLKSGGLAIVPGKPDESELIFRIESDDPDLHMPPKKSGKQLTADADRHAAPLGRAGGARGRRTGPSSHRRSPRCPPSRTPPGRSTRSTASSWPGSRPRGSRPSPRPSKTTLIRRVTLDLTGLPPTLAGGRRLPRRLVAARPTRRSSTACSTRPATASTWRGSGSTPPATATPTACTSTTIARSGPTATGSSTPSTPTSRSTGSSSSSSPATCCPMPTPDQIDRHRLQPLPRLDQRGRLDRGGSLRPQRRRPGRYQRHRLPGPDDRLRPLPRPQVRPDPGEGLLPALRVLQQHRRPRARRQFRQMGADRAGAEPTSKPRRCEAADAEIAALQKDDRGRGGQGAVARMTARPTPPRARPSGDRTSSGSTTPCPRAPARRATAPGTSSASPIIPSSAAAWRCAITAQGLNQRFFDNAGRKLKVGDGRHAVCLCLSSTRPILPRSSCSSGTRAEAGRTAPTGART